MDQGRLLQYSQLPGDDLQSSDLKAGCLSDPTHHPNIAIKKRETASLGGYPNDVQTHWRICSDACPALNQ